MADTVSEKYCHNSLAILSANISTIISAIIGQNVTASRATLRKVFALMPPELSESEHFSQWAETGVTYYNLSRCVALRQHTPRAAIYYASMGQVRAHGFVSFVN